MAENNMKIFDSVRKVPTEAQKKINGGRLNGMTDINPMWRIETLTKQFGPAGIGWYTEVTAKYIEQGANGEACAIVDLNLYVKDGDEWSKPIFGTGGSKYVTNEKNGVYTSDEAYKMAYTDALSVACKALGIGADIYWAAGAPKATATNTSSAKATKTEAKPAKEQPAVPSVGGDELPAPTKKPQKAEANIEDVRAVIVPTDVQGFGGKTLGEIADANAEDLRQVAALTSDRTIKNYAAMIYNDILKKKQAA